MYKSYYQSSCGSNPNGKSPSFQFSPAIMKSARSQPCLVHQTMRGLSSSNLTSMSTEKLQDILKANKRVEEELRLRSVERRREELAQQKVESAKRKLEDWRNKVERMKSIEEEKQEQVRLKTFKTPSPRLNKTNVLTTPWGVPKKPSQQFQFTKPLPSNRYFPTITPPGGPKTVSQHVQAFNAFSENNRNTNSGGSQSQSPRQTFVVSKAAQPRAPVASTQKKSKLTYGIQPKVFSANKVVAKPHTATSSNTMIKKQVQPLSTTFELTSDSEGENDTFYSAVGDVSFTDSDPNATMSSSSDSGVKLSETLIQDWAMTDPCLESLGFSMILLQEYPELQFAMFPQPNKSYKLFPHH